MSVTPTGGGDEGGGIIFERYDTSVRKSSAAYHFSSTMMSYDIHRLNISISRHQLVENN